MWIRGSVFEFSHGKTRPIQLSFDAATKQLDDLERCVYNGHHIYTVYIVCKTY